ncbi:MAG: efflux RND transporter periplasmic adaptor subunit [Desulfomicrobium sp.]|nr:efflux RND transporter periplasmic adaptor subunit [Pseudomonadota bacterium]MBV1713810.1 efflux RND transporter periplasmic adaptor subunit [Desulfomicrobium sp.]MBU4572345.1 efflux RND transporter periplasmic adaptor subunit [Pseudomonadota bacterium]MBU4594323.1 efflux RND transporter periplasmic adaptor subunit [Pseudomonadota bacterium]MBV1719492.1 efflux RND transporter periplasmic adaptor subunit [Desulfomicrobium sp.]
MMSLMSRNKFLLLVVLGLLAGAFIYVVLRSGPLASVPVVVFEVKEMPVEPSLFGIGTVAARYTQNIGPIVSGRVLEILVDVGDRVEPGQVIGEMDPVDLDERLGAQDAALMRAAATVRAAEAQVSELRAKTTYAESQSRRYDTLVQSGAVSRDAFEARQQELQVAQSGLKAAMATVASAKHEYDRLKSEGAGISRQRETVRLVSPVAGLVTRRLIEPGTTAVAGQTVVEIIDPDHIWVNARFDQLRASGLAAGLPARVVLRSRSSETLRAHVYRVEPVADAVTEELLAKVIFESLPDPLPAIGELAEVTVDLPALPPAPAIPGSSVLRNKNTLGVWVVEDGNIEFVPVELGQADLEGMVQVRKGLRAGQTVVSHSASTLTDRSGIKIVDSLPGVPE